MIKFDDAFLFYPFFTEQQFSLKPFFRYRVAALTGMQISEDSEPER